MFGELPSISLKERPYLNSIITGENMPEVRSFNLKTLIYWVKRTPEAIGIVKRIATDIVTEISFKSVANQKTGRPSSKLELNTEDKAISFAKRNSLKQKMIAVVMDWIITGDFYLWKGRLNENQIKEIALKHYQEYGIELKEIETKQFFDEDYNGVNSIEIIPSSTVEIKHSEYKITRYTQKTLSGKERDFYPDEVIHGKFMEIDGKVYGYSPFESSYVALRTINAIQDYGYYYFENGAKIDRVWKFMGNPNSSQIDKFREKLQQYKNLTKSHSDLIMTGADKIEHDSLNEISEEMQYRQLAIHSVGRLAFAFNMPADILSSILGVDVNGTAVGSDIEDAGYNRNIQNAQEYIEDLFNTQLFIPELKVEMSFNRTFKQDQIRTIQYQTQASSFAEFLFRHEYPVSDEYIHELLQIPRKYLEKGEINRNPMITSPFTLPKQPSNKDENSYAEAKKKQQESQQNINPPIGG